jgi:hypothetical protein
VDFLKIACFSDIFQSKEAILEGILEGPSDFCGSKPSPASGDNPSFLKK